MASKKSAAKVSAKGKSSARTATKVRPKSDAQRERLADHEKRIVALENNHPELRALIEENRSQVALLAEKISSVQDGITRQLEQWGREFGEQLSALSQILRDIADRQAAIAKGQAVLAPRQDKVEAAIRQFADRQDEHDRRLEQHERRSAGS